MAVVVAFKYARNPQDATVGPDGVIDWSRAKAAVSENDPVAIEFARQLGADELVGITVGDSDAGKPMARKNAMSRGFDRGIIVSDDAVADYSPTQIAHALAELVQRVEGADLVVTADSSIDEAAGVMPALIAGHLGWPVLLEVTTLERTDSGWRAQQQVRGGTRTVEIDGPLVVATTSDAAVPAVPSMKDILAAGKKPVEVLSASDVDFGTAGWTITGYEKPEKRERKHKMFATAEELAAALREDGVL